METNVQKRNALNFAEVETWTMETFIFSIPAIVAFLLALSHGVDYRIALGAGYSALATSLMNLYGKYKTGV